MMMCQLVQMILKMLFYIDGEKNLNLTFNLYLIGKFWKKGICWIVKEQ
jgi:hypothetical protein